MTDRSGSDDDDKAPPLPEVTVPPWLRTGPTADPSVAAATPAAPSAAGSAEVDAERAAQGEQDDSAKVPPTRIRLGAKRRSAVAEGATTQGAADEAELPTREARSQARSQTRSQAGGQAGTGAAPSAAAGGSSGERAVDDLSTLPLRTVPGTSAPASTLASARAAAPAGKAAPSLAAPSAAAAAPAAADSEPAKTAEPPPEDSAPVTPLLSRRPVRIALLAVAGVAVLGGSAVLGFVVTRGAAAPDPVPVTAAAASECMESVEDGRVVGSGPGSLDSPAGAVLAFDHAYYVDRSAEKAYEAVAPSSRMTEEQLRTEGIGQLAEGTAHCVEVRELAPTLLEVDLTEFPPESEPVLIRQRVRVAENADGTWGIVSITPAG